MKRNRPPRDSTPGGSRRGSTAERNSNEMDLHASMILRLQSTRAFMLPECNLVWNTSKPEATREEAHQGHSDRSYCDLTSQTSRRDQAETRRIVRIIKTAPSCGHADSDGKSAEKQAESSNGHKAGCAESNSATGKRGGAIGQLVDQAHGQLGKEERRAPDSGHQSWTKADIGIIERVA